MSIKVATTSLTAKDNKATNISEALRLIDEAANKGANWVLLPEVFTYHGPYEKLAEVAEQDKGELYQRLAKKAAEHKIVLFAGSFAVTDKNSSGSRVFNRMYVFNRQGEEIARYTKTHLFNLFDSSGGPLYCESNGYIEGDQLSVIDIDGFKVGLTICYDLRFPGLYQALSKNGPLDVMVNAAAFTKATGQAHWEILLRARSIEYQAYSIASNQVGEHAKDKESFGHSMIIDPWGEVLCSTGDMPGVVTAEISKERIKEVRAKLPALANQRPELY